MPHRDFIPRSYLYLRNGYTSSAFLSDVIAGTTVGIVALPLAMALAIASGLTPERGLITAIVAGFLISALGGSRVQIGGPTGAFVVIVSGIVARRGYDGLVAATFIAGIILLVLGLARLGKMIKYIPHPVTTGFTSGIAVVIFSTQVRDFLGLGIPAPPADFIDKWAAYLGGLATLSWHTAVLGVISLATLIYFRRLDPRIPGALIVVVFSSIAVWALGLPVETIGSRFGQIPTSFPPPHFPELSMPLLKELLPDALTIALLAGIESLLSAVVADGMTGDKHNSNTELVAQGVANIASVVCGGIPATGAIARTATNIKTGAKTPLAGMIHALVLLLFMLLLAPLAAYIPLTTLAAILFIVAWNMSEVDRFRYLLRAPRGDVAVLLSTFLLTILVDLTLAVEVGIVMAALLFMKRMSDVTDAIVEHKVLTDDEGEDDIDTERLPSIPEGVEVYEVNGPFFFGVADRFKDMLHRVEKNPRSFVLRLRKVPVVDATALHALREFALKCEREKAQLILCEVQPAVIKAMQAIGLLDTIRPDSIEESLEKALERFRM
ncbi:MAG: sulfate permease [Oligoflexia bacterium]|nr:sulfate permease [Oligoflexia bacterium]